MMLLLCLHKPRTTLDSICISRFRCIKLWLGAIISLHSGPPNVRATSPSGLDPRAFSAPSPANSQCFKILRSRVLHQMVPASRSIWEQCIHGARLDWRAHSMPCSTRPTTCRHVWSLSAQAAASDRGVFVTSLRVYPVSTPRISLCVSTDHHSPPNRIDGIASALQQTSFSGAASSCRNSGAYGTAREPSEALSFRPLASYLHRLAPSGQYPLIFSRSSDQKWS